MQSEADGNYRYICHVVEHFSKFRVLFPMENKTATLFAELFKIKFISYFGLPKIIHTDNGKEFANDFFKSLLVVWPGQVKIIHGAPRHSQSQGLVEQGNETVQMMIRKRRHEEMSNAWSSWLPEIQCKFRLYLGR